MKQVNSYFEGENGGGGRGGEMINDKIIRGEPICMKPSWARPEEGGEDRREMWRVLVRGITVLLSRQ